MPASKGLQVIARDGSWHIYGTYLRTRVRKATEYPATNDMKVEAERIAKQIEMKIVEGTYVAEGSTPKDTFQRAAESYMRLKIREGKITTGVINRIERHIDAWGDMRVEDLTTEIFLDYMETEWPECAPNTCKRYFKTVTSILRHAIAMRWATNVAKVPKIIVDDERDVHFDVDEATAFLDWVEVNYPDYLLAFTVLIDAGLRLSEMLRLRVRDVMSDNIIVKKKVNGKTRTRTVPISSGLDRLFKPVRQRNNRQALIINGPRGEPWNSSGAAGMYLGRILDAGCVYIGSEPLRIHDLRHTFAYLAAQAGADLGDLRDMMGHFDVSMTLRYRGFMPNRARDVIQNLR